METCFDCDTYVICHNGGDVIHAAHCCAGTVVATGQPHYEEFETEEAWAARITELGGNPADFQVRDPELPVPGVAGELPGLVLPAPEGRAKMQEIRRRRQEAANS